MSGFPLPGMGRANGDRRGAGAGTGALGRAPSAALDPDGGFVVAYRVRVVDRRGRPPLSPAPPTARR